MTDVFSPDKRREIMRRVGQNDTTPEIIVRSAVHRMGYRFRLHDRELPGKPDVTLPRHGKAIFVHGCFWHGHKNCQRAARPASNSEFWNKKLAGNIARDKRNLKDLRKLGWKAVVIWECETKNKITLKRKLELFLRS